MSAEAMTDAANGLAAWYERIVAEVPAVLPDPRSRVEFENAADKSETRRTLLGLEEMVEMAVELERSGTYDKRQLDDAIWRFRQATLPKIDELLSCLTRLIPAVSRRGPLQETQDYIGRFVSSCLPRYEDERLEFRPGKGYGEFEGSDLVYQTLLDMVGNLHDQFSDLRIPESYASPRALVELLERSHAFLSSRRGELGTLASTWDDQKDVPQPLTVALRQVAEFEAMVAYVLGLDEVVPHRAENPSRRGYAIQELKEGDLLAGNSSYSVKGFLGAGGMGRVYLVERADGEEFAAKLLSSDRFVIDNTAKERFRREFRVAHKLDHENLVNGIEAFEHQGTLVAIYERLSGESIHSWIEQNGRPTIERGLKWIEQLASGLAALHEADIVHRDVSAKNSFIRTPDLVAVGDYGAARCLGDSTLTGHPLGSLIYISTQQREDPRSAQPSDDVFSLGQVYFYILTGKIPHNMGAASDHASDIPKHVADLVAQMRSDQRRNRPRDGTEVLHRLGAAESCTARLEVPTAKRTEMRLLKLLSSPSGQYHEISADPSWANRLAEGQQGILIDVIWDLFVAGRIAPQYGAGTNGLFAEQMDSLARGNQPPTHAPSTIRQKLMTGTVWSVRITARGEGHFEQLRRTYKEPE